MPTVHEVVRSRRTIHDFAALPVDEQAISRALEGANWAPNHKATWPWRFIRVGPRAREKLIAWNVEIKDRATGLTPAQVSKVQAQMTHPAALVVVSQVLAENLFRRREDYAACACAIQNLCLCLASDGVGSKWTTGAITRDERTYTLLDLDAGREQIIGFVWIGVPARKHHAPQRPPLTDLLRVVS
jgi:nitroreductase